MRIVWFRKRFYAYDRVGGQPRRTSLGTTDRQVAERRLVDLQATLRRKATTVSEIFADYLSERGPHIASQETLRFAHKRLIPVFGHLRPDQVTRALCRAYAAQRRRQSVGDGTIRRELVTLAAALRWQDKATPAVIELPPAPPPKSRHLTREQYRALRDAAAITPHLHLFVILAYSTAGRATAILELTWDRVDFDRGQIRLGLGERRTKGRATVPMTDGARAALLEARPAALSEYVIEYAGGPVRSVKRAFAAAARRAELPAGTSPHVLRHSAAVHMAESGVPMPEIAQVLGHSSESVTFRTYARYSPDYLRRAVSVLE
jgi:integrase